MSAAFPLPGHRTVAEVSTDLILGCFCDTPRAKGHDEDCPLADMSDGETAAVAAKRLELAVKVARRPTW